MYFRQKNIVLAVSIALSGCASLPDGDFKFHPKDARECFANALSEMRDDPKKAPEHFDVSEMTAAIQKRRPNESIVTEENVAIGLISIFTLLQTNLPKWIPAIFIPIKKYAPIGKDTYEMKIETPESKISVSLKPNGKGCQFVDMTSNQSTISTLVSGKIEPEDGYEDPYK